MLPSGIFSLVPDAGKRIPVDPDKLDFVGKSRDAGFSEHDPKLKESRAGSSGFERKLDEESSRLERARDEKRAYTAHRDDYRESLRSRKRGSEQGESKAALMKDGNASMEMNDSPNRPGGNDSAGDGFDRSVISQLTAAVERLASYVLEAMAAGNSGGSGPGGSFGAFLDMAEGLNSSTPSPGMPGLLSQVDLTQEAALEDMLSQIQLQLARSGIGGMEELSGKPGFFNLRTGGEDLSGLDSINAEIYKAGNSNITQRLAELIAKASRNINLEDNLNGGAAQPGVEQPRGGALTSLFHGLEPARPTIESPVNIFKDEILAASGINRVERVMAGEGLIQVRLRLHPPELGHLVVEFKRDENGLRVEFHTPHPAVLKALEEAGPKMMEKLADAGIDLGSMDVSLADKGLDWEQAFSPLDDASRLPDMDGIYFNTPDVEHAASRHRGTLYFADETSNLDLLI